MTNKILDSNDILQQRGGEAVQKEQNRAADEALEEIDNLRAETENFQAQQEAETTEKTANAKAQFEKKLADKLFRLPAEDNYNASRIYLAFGNEIRYNRTNNFWGFFKGGKWLFDTDKNSALYPYTRRIAALLADNLPAKIPLPTKEDGSIDGANPLFEKAKIHNQFCDWAQVVARSWNRRKTQADAVEMLKGVEEIIIRQEDLDKHPMLLNVKNGVINLEDGKLYPAAPELLMTKQANVDFNPAARAPVFEEFMQQILPDEMTRRAVLRFLGYCLTGRVNEEKALFVWGSGANGKGSLFQTMLKLFGDYSTPFNINALLKPKFPKDGEAATPEFAKLEGARLAIVEEIPRGALFDVAKFKNVTGGDSIPIRPLYQAARSINPTHKFIFSGNDLPRVDSASDDGFNRRLNVVKFPMQFTGDNADITLKARLETPAELAGIFNILLAECLQWQKPKAEGGGLLQSAAMEEEKQTYLSNNDWLADFINEECELGAEFDVSRKNLLAALKKYDSRARRYTDKQLVETLEKLEGVSLHEKERHGKYNSVYFSGIRLTDNDIEPPPFD